MQLTVEIPDALGDKDAQELAALAREALVVRLYALGDLSSGEGAQALGISRREFLYLLGRYNVSIFDDTMDPLKEAGLG
ncbi:MAG TPA: UPF0175 family protein [Ktedonobacterales bacterium]